MSRLAHKALAIATAATISIAGPVGASMTIANAQGTGQSAEAAAPIDVNRIGSLTVAKQIGEVGAEGNTAGAGFTFELEKIQTAPLNTAQGWQDVRDIVAGGAEAAPVDGNFTTQTQNTDTNGNATFSNLSVGLYRVTELRNGNYTVARPFLVTLPLTENGSYNYNPTVSPKNQLLQPTKEADDTGVTVGQNIHYTIEAPVPATEKVQEGVNNLTKFTITDPLPAELQYVADSAVVKIGNVAADGTFTEVTNDLQVGTDYTVSNNDQNLVVDFAPSGLAKLQELRDANAGLNVQLAFDAKVVKLPANGKIENIANVATPNSDTNIDTKPKNPDETDPNNPQGPKVTQFANVEITKTVSGGAEDATGNGAQFQVFKCTQGANGEWTVEGDSLQFTNEAGTEALTDKNITAENGTTADNAVAKGFGFQVDQEAQYCAVETKAPTGFVANPDPFPLTKTTEATDTQRAVFTGKIDNVKDNVWGNLPATGERTMLILLGLGALLFAGGAAYQLNRRNA